MGQFSVEKPVLPGSVLSGNQHAPVCAGQAGAPLLNAGPCREKPRGGCDGRIAQLVEQLTLNQRVQGSSPCAPTIEKQ